MSFWRELRLLIHISRSYDIARRYFVTNGFDGALAMLGLNMGFYASGDVPAGTALSACAGTAVALAMSGLSSAYVSEAAERRKELQELERFMLADLGESAHAKAARIVPFVIAAVNGFAPLLIALVIMSPLILAVAGIPLGMAPIDASILLAFVVISLLGAFLGRVSGHFWLWSALRTLVIALLTALVILLLSRLVTG